MKFPLCTFLVGMGLIFASAAAFLLVIGAPYLALLVPAVYILGFVVWLLVGRAALWSYLDFTLCHCCRDRLISAENFKQYEEDLKERHCCHKAK